jgi:phosphatidylglycerol lysyltransferase
MRYTIVMSSFRSWRIWRFFDLNSLLLRFAGVVTLLSIPFARHDIDDLLPLELTHTSRFLSFMLGIGLLYLASQVARRKRSAYYLAVAGLWILTVIELVSVHSPWQILFYAVTLTSLIKDREEFVVKSDMLSLRRGILTSVGILIVLLLFAFTVFTVLDQREYGRHLNTHQSLSVTYNAFLGRPLPLTHHLTRHELFLIDLLRLTGIAALGLMVVSLFQPLRLRRESPDSYREEAAELLQKYSTSTEDFFKLWPHDKHYFFYRDSVIAYKPDRGNVLILDGVTGKSRDLMGARRAFLVHARENGWATAVIHADQQEAEAWEKLGLQRLFIGSEAVINVPGFVEHTAGNKHFRYVRNKASENNLEFEVWEPPHSDEKIETLREISDAWLGSGGHREYTFLMGYFSPEYLRSCRVAVMKQDSVVTAYANFIPVFQERAASIDHMRSRPGVPGISMHYLLLCLTLHLHDKKITSFNLGLAPLSKLDENAENISEKILAGIKRLAGRYYSFEGLEQFKGKFVPAWESRYIVYQGTPARLVPLAASLNSATTYRAVKDKFKGWLLAAAVVAAAAYASFPLAYFLNRPYFTSGLVSNLGKDGQPYAWLFNGFDIVSGLVAAGIFSYLYRFRRPQEKLLRWALALACASSIAGILAALLALPPSFDDSTPLALAALENPLVLLHGICSFVNSTGFVLSAILWAGYYYRRNGWGWRQVVAIVALLIATAGFVIGLLLPGSQPILQRSFITTYAVWLVAFTYTILQAKRP